MITSAKRKVLVIDDEIGPRESMRILLKNDYEVHCAESAQQGIKLLKEMTPDLVILDIRMPHMNGIEALQRMRKIDGEVSLVILTGYGTLETAQEALRMGATDYLKKPFDTREMLENVRKYVSRTRMVRQRSQGLFQLVQLNNQFKKEIQKIKQMAAPGQSSDEFAHDLVNSLATVLGHVQILLKKLAVDETAKPNAIHETLLSLDLIEKHVKHSLETVRVWREAGRRKFHSPARIPILDILRDITSAIELHDDKNKAQLKLKVETPDLAIMANRTEIFHAIQNVVMNAMRSTKARDNRQVTITCLRDGNDLLVQVRDNGHGMSHGQPDGIFKTRSAAKSDSGESLPAFCETKRIIEAHGGSILAESQPGKGTSVSIRLPLLTGGTSQKPAIMIFPQNPHLPAHA
ncbi:MAG: response regulator [Verrucomicrobiae bacterium]|nr:response regulator [Verrucomicrobiae bacterium]